MNTQSQEQEHEKNGEIKKLIGLFLDNWKLILVCALVGVLLAIIALQYIEKSYRIHARILIEETQAPGNSGTILGSSAGKMLQDFGGFMGGSSNINNELAVIHSRNLFESVVRKMDLNIRYYENTMLDKRELFNEAPFKVAFLDLPKSLKEAVFFNVSMPDEAHIQLSSQDFTKDFSVKVMPGDTISTEIGKLCVTNTAIAFDSTIEYEFSVSSVDQIVDAYVNHNLSVEINDKLSSYMDIELKSNSPEKGEAILATLIDEYLGKNVEYKNIILDSTMSFISGRVSLLNNELNSVEQNIKTFKQINNLANIEEQSKVIIDQSSDYYKQLNELDVQANIVDASLQYVMDEHNNKRPMPAISASQDPNFLSLLQNYNAIAIQRDHLALSNTIENPRLQNIDIQLKNLRNDIINSLTNQKQSIEIARKKLQVENKIVINDIKNVPEQEKTYLELSRQQQVKQALYLYLLEKNEETAIAKSSNIASARIIETPKSDFSPYFPSKRLFLAGGFILGVVLPLSFIMLGSILSNKVTSRDDIEATLPGIPILSEISRDTKATEMGVRLADRSVIAEQFRAMRTNLRFAFANKECPVVLLTSSMSGEGKSYIAINLAYMYALSGKKVVLMELDLRKPKLSSYLNMNNDKGFSNYIISDLCIKEVIKRTKIHENVFLVSSGSIPPNPVELLINEKVKHLFEALKKQFDLIIVDTPPVGIVTDAQELTVFSDVNLYVVRHKYTFKNQLTLVKNLNNEGKISNTYVILNDVVDSVSSRYGYGYGRYNNYGLGDHKSK